MERGLVASAGTCVLILGIFEFKYPETKFPLKIQMVSIKRELDKIGRLNYLCECFLYTIICNISSEIHYNRHYTGE